MKDYSWEKPALRPGRGVTVETDNAPKHKAKTNTHVV